MCQHSIIIPLLYFLLLYRVSLSLLIGFCSCKFFFQIFTLLLFTILYIIAYSSPHYAIFMVLLLFSYTRMYVCIATDIFLINSLAVAKNMQDTTLSSL